PCRFVEPESVRPHSLCAIHEGPRRGPSCMAEREGFTPAVRGRRPFGAAPVRCAVQIGSPCRFVEPESVRPHSPCAIHEGPRRGPSCMAEREGFEPSKGLLSALTPLAGERFRPLSHLSVAQISLARRQRSG